jgi:hypothetical protein
MHTLLFALVFLGLLVTPAVVVLRSKVGEGNKNL